jgi:hypothetical protein
MEIDIRQIVLRGECSHLHLRMLGRAPLVVAVMRLERRRLGQGIFPRVPISSEKLTKIKADRHQSR